MTTPPELEPERRAPAAYNRRATDSARDRVLAIAGVALVISAIALVIALTLALGILGTAGKIERQREGRAVAVGVTCGALTAVIQAGRATIGGSAGGLPPELARFLERHGYPPKDVREAQQKAAAEAYARTIATTVRRVSGFTDLVAPSGDLDCRRLKAAAAASGD